MAIAQRLDDNPCRPRHFRPPAPCAPVVVDPRATEAIERSRTRLVAAGALVAIVFLVVALRLVEIVVFAGGTAESHPGHIRPVVPPLQRADIVDRNGTLLATTLNTPSLYADARQILDAEEATRALTSVLPRDPADIHARLVSGKSFVWLKRRLTPRQEYEVNRLGIPGFQFDPEERRFYPLGDVAAHVIGYTGIDNIGQAGIERALDSNIKGRGEPLALSLDARVQFILREELSRVISDFTAKGGAGVVMDVRTGEIVAMVSLPDFDPNHPDAVYRNAAPDEAKNRIFNKVTLGEYELGSVFKIFNTAMALDSGVATMTKKYDAINAIHIGRYTISDYHGKHRWLSVPELFMYSSNIASARMAAEAGVARQRGFLARLGMLKPLPIAFDELAKPRYPSHWREVNVMTIAFGHGISVSPLHLATGAAAVINGGILHPPTLLKLPSGATPPGERVMSQKTSDNMRKLLRLVVEYGTARLAEVPGYVVGGKTGTAEKNVNGHYQRKKLLSTFVAGFPMNDPKYLIVTLVDEPHPNKASHGYATAGWTVVPATARLIQRIAPLLGVPPVDESSPAVTKALAIENPQGKRFEMY